MYRATGRHIHSWISSRIDVARATDESDHGKALRDQRMGAEKGKEGKEKI
jgi:hypothetical protein